MTQPLETLLAFDPLHEAQAAFKALDSPYQILSQLKDHLRAVEQERDDLLHVIEFLPLAKKEREAVYRQLNDAMERRRKIKDHIYKMEPLAELSNRLSKNGTLTDLKNMVGRLTGYSRPFQRVYTCKQLTEYQALFDKHVNVTQEPDNG